MVQDITDTERLLQLNTRVLSEESVDELIFGDKGEHVVYVFSQTEDNENGLDIGVNLVEQGMADQVAIIDDVNRTNTGYPGAEKWESQLLKHLSEEQVTVIPCAEHLQTLSEAFAVVEYAKRERVGFLTIVSPAFHQLRAFLSMVTAVNAQNPQGLRVYNSTAAIVGKDWRSVCRHSQGTLTATRQDLIVTELRRIGTYQKESIPKPLVSAKEALEYIAWRDSE